VPGDQPYAGHNSAVLLVLSLTGVTVTPMLLLYGVWLLIRALMARTDRAIVKAAATGAWTGAIGMYTWGLLSLLLADERAQADACNEALGGKHLIGYSPSFIPLRFGCRTSDGHTIDVIVPSYVNLSVAALGICAIALTAYLFILSKEEGK
jgi:hypothetical protein